MNAPNSHGEFLRVPMNSDQIMSTKLDFLVEEAPEGGYTARALGHAIFTEGDTPEQVEENVGDARPARCCEMRRFADALRASRSTTASGWLMASSFG